jgi:hypothetical protein
MFRTPPRPPADRNYEKLIAKEKLLVGHISIKQQENFCQTPPPPASPPIFPSCMLMVLIEMIVILLLIMGSL